MLNGVKHLGCIHVDVHEILRFAQDDKCKGKQLFTINYSLFTNNMDIKLQISDSAYQRLVSSGSRIQGTIGLINPTEGNFSEHRKSGARPGTKSIKLRHGRASVGDTQVRLTLRIGLDEVDVIPSQVIEDESKEASAFIEGMYDDAFGY